MKVKINILILLFSVLSTANVWAQTKVKLNKAESLQGVEKDGENYSKVVGGVWLQHENTHIWCDTAYRYTNKNALEAIGNVKIKEGDSITITGDRLFYDGNTKLAQMRENVVYRDDSITMYTDFLDYDMQGKLAYYFNGGKVVDSKNVLTSEKGYYNTASKFVSFKEEAILKTPDATIFSDTLQYDLNTDIAYFKGPTEIIKRDSTKLNANDGEYITRIEQSRLKSGTIETRENILSGDKFFFDEIQQFYTVTGNVEMFNKENEIIINGKYAKYWKLEGIIKVYEDALMKKPFNEDTLYLSADTLVSIESEIPEKKRLLAYHNVKVYNIEMQGKADSLSYHLADSTIFMYDDPLIWNQGNQIEADSINMLISNNKIDKMFLSTNSFVISEDSLLQKFNQIKGREMVAHFLENKIDQIDVFGNAESIFFAPTEADTILLGLNKTVCSNMIIDFKEGDMNSIKTFVNPDASLIPPHEIQAPDTRLKGFKWRAEDRPTKEEVLYGIRKEKPEIKPKKEIERIETLNKAIKNSPDN
ncbi:OstA-like protein [Fulvivirgaceae bacterium BMA10]|uniref:OstA-like protein n=1 Tax=Splendidivirga corallicola TaxID=3051826 RepID=A0ABT8KLN7_9BACT|nr:OstA-like protein [Fulvivirgaceae bacterium BMA10]